MEGGGRREGLPGKKSAVLGRVDAAAEDHLGWFDRPNQGLDTGSSRQTFRQCRLFALEAGWTRVDSPLPERFPVCGRIVFSNETKPPWQSCRFGAAHHCGTISRTKKTKS